MMTVMAFDEEQWMVMRDDNSGDRWVWHAHITQHVRPAKFQLAVSHC